MIRGSLVPGFLCLVVLGASSRLHAQTRAAHQRADATEKKLIAVDWFDEAGWAVIVDHRPGRACRSRNRQGGQGPAQRAGHQDRLIQAQRGAETP